MAARARAARASLLSPIVQERKQSLYVGACTYSISSATSSGQSFSIPTAKAAMLTPCKMPRASLLVSGLRSEYTCPTCLISDGFC